MNVFCPSDPARASGGWGGPSASTPSAPLAALRSRYRPEIRAFLLVPAHTSAFSARYSLAPASRPAARALARDDAAVCRARCVRACASNGRRYASVRLKYTVQSTEHVTRPRPRATHRSAGISLRPAKSRTPSRGTPPGSSPASPYQQAPAGSADRESGDRPAKQIRTAVRTMDWNARRSVVQSCSLLPPPDDSCIARALRKCSIAS